MEPQGALVKAEVLFVVLCDGSSASSIGSELSSY